MFSFFLRLSRTKLLFLAATMIVIVALIDWRVELNVSFGFLYLFPMVIVGSCLPRWQLAILGGLCTLLAELFSPFTWDLAAGVPRDIFMFAATLALHSSLMNPPKTGDSRRSASERLSKRLCCGATLNSN